MKMKNKRRLGKAAEEHGDISGMVDRKKHHKKVNATSAVKEGPLGSLCYNEYSHWHLFWGRIWENIYHILSAGNESRIIPFPCHPPSLWLIVNNWFLWGKINSYLFIKLSIGGKEKYCFTSLWSFGVNSSSTCLCPLITAALFTYCIDRNSSCPLCQSLHTNKWS